MACSLICFAISAQAVYFAKDSPVKKISKQSAAGRRQRELALRGKALFAAYQCLDCHKLAGKGCIDGINLDGEGDLRTTSFLKEQLEDPEKHAAKIKPQETSLMTPPNMNRDEVQAVVAYLKTLKSAKRKAQNGKAN
jgi:mono/diheme cytochrome c family protein